MSEMYLTQGIIEIIGWLRGRPVDTALAIHLLSVFGKDGEATKLAAIKKSKWASCPHNDGQRCYNDSCGICEPYRDGPLLDEVLSEIHSFESGHIMFDEKGELIAVDMEAIPF